VNPSLPAKVRFHARNVHIDGPSAEAFSITAILLKRSRDTKSAQNPSVSRSHDVRFGARCRERFMISNWCLTASDSAATTRKPPGLASFASVTRLLYFHQALVKRKYYLLYNSRKPHRPGPKGPSKELIDAVVEMKRRNPPPRLPEDCRTNIECIRYRDQ